MWSNAQSLCSLPPRNVRGVHAHWQRSPRLLEHLHRACTLNQYDMRKNVRSNALAGEAIVASDQEEMCHQAVTCALKQPKECGTDAAVPDVQGRSS